ncbi:hypothetical protein NEOLEDRAFT_546259 [Neolentinus lepideus HHB14362 ss-1]|uniref:Uncharacterized protein n=1 Tax=Neolentinus lepideus HHB14362 ss-1 TaxID=1314782 RepID=A0A165R7Y0_9AGAM|nr:hypothetical protein NEOLEDRAFT_546259 [Neolentinus lepideus HHB14362 ss-1]
MSNRPQKCLHHREYHPDPFYSGSDNPKMLSVPQFNFASSQIDKYSRSLAPAHTAVYQMTYSMASGASVGPQELVLSWRLDAQTNSRASVLPCRSVLASTARSWPACASRFEFKSKRAGVSSLLYSSPRWSSTKTDPSPDLYECRPWLTS